MMKPSFKTAVCLTLVILLSAALFSCSGDKPAQLSNESGISRYTDVDTTADNSSKEELVYPAVYVRTDVYGTDDTIYPRIVTISTREELEKYTSDNENLYDFQTNAYSVSFYDTATKYDAAFFEKSSLVIAIVKEASSSYTHGNRGFTLSDSGYDLNLIRFVPSDAVENEAIWHVVFEVPKTSPVLENRLQLSVTEENIGS